MLVVCPLLFVLLVLVVLSVAAWFIWFVASGLWTFFLVLVLVVCPLLLFLMVLGVLIVAAWFVWCVVLPLVCWLHLNYGAGCVSSVVAFACPCCAPCCCLVYMVCCFWLVGFLLNPCAG